MPLSGTFDTIQLGELVQWLHTTSKSGTLTVSVDMEESYLVFRQGELIAVGSDDPLRLDLSQVLLKRNLIDESNLHAALRSARAGRTLIDVLLQDGIVSESVISLVQAEHVFHIVLDLFFQEEGSFHFTTSRGSQGLLAGPEIAPMNVLRQPISTQQLLMEGMQRLDEWNQIRKIFPDSYVIVEALEGQADNADNSVWSELRRIGKPVSIGELCLHLGGSRFEIFRQLYRAYNQKLLAIDLAPAGQTRHTCPGSVEVLVDNARVLLSEDQYDEAREVLSTAVNLDPDNDAAHALLRQAREGQLEQLYQRIPPHRTPVLSVPRNELSRYRLSPRETYLASRLTGRLDVAALVVSTPLGEVETLRTLRKLLHAGIARWED